MPTRAYCDICGDSVSAEEGNRGVAWSFKDDHNNRHRDELAYVDALEAYGEKITRELIEEYKETNDLSTLKAAITVWERFTVEGNHSLKEEKDNAGEG